MQEILKSISKDFFDRKEPHRIEELISNNAVDEQAIKSQWLGYPPATKDAIEAKEKELNVILPPSYKEFLSYSNGFRIVSPFLDNLWPIEKVDWARNTEEQWWFNLMEESVSQISDDEYLIYDERQDSIGYRSEYFRHSLKVSEWYDGMCVFLNPLIKHEDEWEVLEYATWYAGAQRYRSFREYLESIHKTNQMLISNRS
jgi:hypothetical protein